MHSRIIQTAINTNYKQILSQQHEWQSDYPWFIKRIEGDKILDLGCMAHAFFTKILGEYGFNVTGVDLHKDPFELEISLNSKNFDYISADVRKISLPDNSFSTIIAPSLLEHIGVGFYGDKKGGRARIKALQEWFRLLKEDGVLLVQIPYGAKSRIIKFKNKSYYQIYTAEMVEKEFADYEIEEISYHSFEPHGWIEVSKSVADHIDHKKPFAPCLAKISARKKKVIRVEIPNSEIVDKMIILGIKKNLFKDKSKIKNVEKEILSLKEAFDEVKKKINPREIKKLAEINQGLWTAEEKIRKFSNNCKSEKEFIRLSKEICSLNSKRIDQKKKINKLTNSSLKEEKEYKINN